MPTHRLTHVASGLSIHGEIRYPARTPVLVEPLGRTRVQITFPRGASIAVWNARVAARELRPICKRTRT